MITFKIYKNGSYGFQIKTGIKKNNVEIGHHSSGYDTEELARDAAEDILSIYRKKYEVKEIT